MQKNEFEKQVQQKMEELKLHPSDSVWLNIEAHISKKKRRRLAWVFFPILLICLGGGYWLIDSIDIQKQGQQNKLSKDLIKKDSTAEIQTDPQFGKDVNVLNQTKKIIRPSFVNKSKKQRLSKQGNTETVLARLVLKKKPEDISAPDKNNLVEQIAVLNKNKSLLANDKEDVKEEGKIISDQISETNNTININNDSPRIKVTTDNINEDKEAKTLIESKQPKKEKFNKMIIVMIIVYRII